MPSRFRSLVSGSVRVSRHHGILAGGLAAVLGALAPALTASAVPVSVDPSNSANCDVLSVPTEVHELGQGSASAPSGPFPDQEQILTSLVSPFTNACDFTVDPTTQVAITNLTGSDWEEVWYVADPETSIVNFDGFVNGAQAFKIDSIGLNRPLGFESMNFDGIFEAGETWWFNIDGYFNTLGLPASAFRSCAPLPGPCNTGLVGSFSGGDPDSSGSIIALPIPEPGTAVLLASGLAGLAFCGRRRRIDP